MIPQKTVKYVMASSLLIKKALDRIEQTNADTAAATAISTPVLERLTKIGGLDAPRRQEAERMLSKHAGSIEILGYALDQIESLRSELSRTKAAELGQPITAVKEASDYSNYLGRRTSDISEADRVMARTLGVSLD